MSNLNIGCLGIPGCNHPVDEKCNCPCHIRKSAPEGAESVALPDIKATSARFEDSNSPIIPEKKCLKCQGKKWYQYDDNHIKPCEECCDHEGVPFPDKANGNPDRFYCMKGCGAERPAPVSSNLEPTAAPEKTSLEKHGCGREGCACTQKPPQSEGESASRVDTVPPIIPQKKVKRERCPACFRNECVCSGWNYSPTATQTLDTEKGIEDVAQKLHSWYLEACLRPESGLDFNPAAQEPYEDLKETQKFLDRYIAEKVIALIKEERDENYREMNKQMAEQYEAGATHERTRLHAAIEKEKVEHDDEACDVRACDQKAHNAALQRIQDLLNPSNQ